MTDRFHICMILDQGYPPDLRVENEARSLVEAGFEVTVLSIGPDSRPAEEMIEGVRVVRPRIPAQVRNKMRGLSGSIPFIEWYVLRQLKRIHRRFPINALHAHDLYLFGAALRSGKRLKVPVVGDMHENWVEALRHYKWSTTVPGKWVVNLDRWNELELRWSREVDRLVVVIDEMAERLRERGLPDDHVCVVPNTIHLDEFDSWPSDPPSTFPEGFPSLIYTGGMDRHRGLEDPIRAMPAILARWPEAKLVFVGDGAVRGELEELCTSLHLGDSVWFAGWQAQDAVKGFIAKADIGLIPHLKTQHTDHTIPHKLFHYMHMRLPVLVSNCKPLERIVNASESGKVYSSGRPDDLVNQLASMLASKEVRERMGESGHLAVSTTWNWNATAVDLISMYQELAGPGESQSAR